MAEKQKPVPAIDLTIAKIHEGKNARTSYELDSLIESIKEFGVLQAILVTPMKNGKHELIAGHRRLRACKQLKMTMIPARIFDVDPADQAAIATIENMQREDLDPFEMSEQIRSMAITNQMSIETIAEKCSIPQKLAAQHVAIATKTLPVFRQLLKIDEITLHALLMLSRIPRPAQEEFCKKLMPRKAKKPNRRIEGWVVRNFLDDEKPDLSKMPFKKNIEIGGKPPCDICQYVTSGNLDLFAEKEEVNTYCTNAACHAVKLQAFITKKIAEYEKLGCTILDQEPKINGKDYDRTLSRHTHTKAFKKHYKARCSKCAKRAVWIDPTTGVVELLCLDMACLAKATKRSDLAPKKGATKTADGKDSTPATKSEESVERRLATIVHDSIAEAAIAGIDLTVPAHAMLVLAAGAVAMLRQVTPSAIDDECYKMVGEALGIKTLNRWSFDQKAALKTIHGDLTKTTLPFFALVQTALRKSWGIDIVKMIFDMAGLKEKDLVIVTEDYLKAQTKGVLLQFAEEHKIKIKVVPIGKPGRAKKVKKADSVVALPKKALVDLILKDRDWKGIIPKSAKDLFKKDIK